MKYYLYDFDGTIYDGDSGVDFVIFSFKKYPSIIKYLPKVLFFLILYILKIIKKERAKEAIFEYLKDIPEIENLVNEFWEKHSKKIKSFWLEKKSHNKDIIISASCYFWLKPIKEKYKVLDLIATDMDEKTGKIKGKNCHGEHKVELFEKKYKGATIEEMYTDSHHDLPLIKRANRGYLVKKNTITEYKY